MKKYYSISEAAQMVEMTSETLRHYDRIGLVSPAKRSAQTGYRYYSASDITLLKIIHTLRDMGLSLPEIRDGLECDDLRMTIDFFTRTEAKVEKKIEELQYARKKMQAAKASYLEKLRIQQLDDGFFVQAFPQRPILLSDSMEAPTLENLYNYLSNYYQQLPPALRDSFAFEDLAGIYSSNGRDRLFALCIRYCEADGLEILPEGRYLCVNCSRADQQEALEKALKYAQELFQVQPTFSIQIVMLTGIAQWNYQIQIFLHEDGE